MEYVRRETATLREVTDDYCYGCRSSSAMPFGLLPSHGTGELEA
jgi:hypothetical protein